jgi:hypothetical protein
MEPPTVCTAARGGGGGGVGADGAAPVGGGGGAAGPRGLRSAARLLSAQHRGCHAGRMPCSCRPKPGEHSSALLGASPGYLKCRPRRLDITVERETAPVKSAVSGPNREPGQIDWMLSERETVVTRPWPADNCPCVAEAANRVHVGIRDGVYNLDDGWVRAGGGDRRPGAAVAATGRRADGRRESVPQESAAVGARLERAERGRVGVLRGGGGVTCAVERGGGGGCSAPLRRRCGAAGATEHV